MGIIFGVVIGNSFIKIGIVKFRVIEIIFIKIRFIEISIIGIDIIIIEIRLLEIDRTLAFWLECWPMSPESYQRLSKMVLDTSLLNTQHYKVKIKGKVEQSREWSSTLHYTLV